MDSLVIVQLHDRKHMVLKLSFIIDGIRGTDVQYKYCGQYPSTLKLYYEFVRN